MNYITVADETYEIDTDEGERCARQALREAGLAEAPVWHCPQATLDDAIAAGFDGAYKSQTQKIVLGNGQRVVLPGVPNKFGPHVAPLSDMAPYMDDEIRERLHVELVGTGVSDQEWLDRYCERHRAKHGEPFIIN